MDEATERRIKEECIGILREQGCPENVIRHCIAVADLAVEIAKNYDDVDEEVVLRGALLHDIGRSKTHGIAHGIVGGEIARSLGLDEKIVKIIERHVGAGITADEAKRLGLPNTDLVPRTVEEKIVACADNLINGDRRISIEESLAEMRAKLGDDHPAIERAKKLYDEVLGASSSESHVKGE
ncbi:MAG: TIGR00295 family protein [Canidatus Methanoxibalbensis ujae]|nr:TIGR00295 family protein [Candidatus Methanoxibalbensis ujae]MCW7078004.1 TIGR00295 family protein [Candidatus Methanoxibalbensis ujae]